VEDEYDQERIVRSWYSNEDWGAEEIEEKVSDLKNANLLEKEAKRIKPKLDQAAEAIAQRKEEEAQQIRQLEMRYKKDYIVRLQELFSKDRIANVAFNPTEKQNLLTSLISDDVEVAMPGGKKVKMPYLEALITYHRFSPKADLENLALATMILTDRAAFDAKYSKMLETKVTSEFVKDHKYDANKKAGLLKVKDNGQKTTPTPSNKGWGNVFKK
jgi:flagellar biosynthesis GTPase FlhF